MKNKRVLITGSNGFIGSKIATQLRSEQNMVLPLRQEEYYKSDFKQAIASYNPDIIIHCGAYGNHSTQQDDQETFEANIVKTYLLLDATKDIPYEAFINIGSSSEYGKKNYPMREDMVPEPLTMYGATKAAGTMLARAFAKKYGKPIVTVRPFSVYGPGEAEHRFIPTIIRSLMNGEQLNIEPGAYHDWIYIDDLLDGILKVIENAKLLSGNIGTGVQYRNDEVYAMLTLITGANTALNIKKDKMRPQDSNYWVADNKILRLCGWKPKTKLMEGLRKTYEAYISKEQ
jgi:nucleoside-diphosphate-sugar epimerase